MRRVPIVIPFPRVLSFLHSSSGIRLKRVGLEQAPYRTPLFRWNGFVTLLFRTRLELSVLYIALSTAIVCSSTSVGLNRSKS